MSASILCLVVTLTADPSLVGFPPPVDSSVEAFGDGPSGPERGIQSERPDWAAGTAESAGTAASVYNVESLSADGGRNAAPQLVAECVGCEPQQHGFYAGFESLFVKPYFSSAAAFERISTGTPTVETVESFDWDFGFAPRVWAGYAGRSGVGAQVRYWHLNADAGRSATGDADFDFQVKFDHGDTRLIADASSDETISAQHSLQLHALDADVTVRRDTACGSVTVAGGIRYVQMTQEYSARVFDSVGTFEKSILTNHDFSGVGPTVSMSGRRRLGGSDFSVFASGRASVVYGDATLDMREHNPVPVFPSDNDRWSQSGEDLIPITELQVGIDWSTTAWGNRRLFLQTALEAQVWFDAGTGMNTTASDGHNTSPQAGNLGLFGLTAGGGLNY